MLSERRCFQKNDCKWREMARIGAIYRNKVQQGCPLPRQVGAEDTPSVTGFGPRSRVVPFQAIKCQRTSRTLRRRKRQRFQSRRSICSDAVHDYSYCGGLQGKISEPGLGPRITRITPILGGAQRKNHRSGKPLLGLNYRCVGSRYFW